MMFGSARKRSKFVDKLSDLLTFENTVMLYLATGLVPRAGGSYIQGIRCDPAGALIALDGSRNHNLWSQTPDNTNFMFGFDHGFGDSPNGGTYDKTSKEYKKGVELGKAIAKLPPEIWEPELPPDTWTGK